MTTQQGRLVPTEEVEGLVLRLLPEDPAALARWEDDGGFIPPDPQEVTP